MSDQQTTASNWLCIALALVPFGLSCWFNGSHAASPVIGERATPSLVFDQYMINYGEHPVTPIPLPVAGTDPDDPKAAKVMGFAVPFMYRNVSDQEVRIQSLTPSCGCLRPQIDSMTIAPGEYGRLLMPIRTANEAAGPHEYLVKVLYEDGQPHEIDLTTKLVLPDKKIEVSPKAMWFYQSGTEVTPMQLTVTDRRAESFQINNISCSSDFWTVKQVSDRLGADSERIITLNVTLAANIPAGRHRGIINIETDDPMYPRIQVPIGCQGLAADDEIAMTVEPTTVVLQPTPTGTLQATTVITAPGSQPVKVQSITTSPEFVDATHETNDNNQTVITVSANLKTKDQSKTQRAIVTIRIEASEAPLTIPVIIPPQDTKPDQ